MHPTISAPREYVEITPSGAEQSATRDGNKGTYGADRAIDGDISTGSSTMSGGGQWFKVMLGGLSCVKEVKWYYLSSGAPKTTWKCAGDSCTCSGSYCSWSSMDVITDGEYETPFDSDCKYGDSVQFTFSASWYVAFSEIEIVGMTGKVIKYD